MAIIQGNSKSASGFDTRLIEDSVWLDGSADYFSRTPAVAGNTSRWIVAFWVRRHAIKTGAAQNIISAGSSTSNLTWIRFDDADFLDFAVYQGSVTARKRSAAKYRDTAWMHCCISFDSGSAVSAADRIKMFVNGNEITEFSTTTNTPTDETTAFNANVLHEIGRYSFNGTEDAEVSVAQFCMLEGKSFQNNTITINDILDSFEFGNNGSQFGPQSNADLTALTADAFGTNSFALDFSNSAHLGHDSRPHNYKTYSEAFDSWALGSTPVITANTVANPIDGFQTADTVAGTYTYSSLREEGITLAASTDHTFSIYLKNIDSVKTRIGLYDVSGSVWLIELQISWSSGVPTTFSNTTSATVTYEDVGNGWYRVAMTKATSTGTSYGAYFYPSYGANGQSLYAYGAQIEQGALSSYLPNPKNLVRNSEEFDNSYWTKLNGATITGNQIAAPDGTTTADLATAGSALYSGIFARRYLTSTEVVPSTQYTLSCYVKKGNYRYLHLRQIGRFAAFDFDTKTFFFSNTTDLSTGYEELSNGWYRLYTTTTHASSITDFIIDIAFANSSGTSSFTPAGTETVYVWGAQYELGPTATSYRKTVNTFGINVVPNNFTPTSITAANQSTNTPSLEFPTLNPINGDASLVAALAYGNRLTTTYVHDGGDDGPWDSVFATRSMGRTGKYYYEVRIHREAGGNGFPAGIHETNTASKNWGTRIGHTTATYGLGYGLYSAGDSESYYTNNTGANLSDYSSALVAGDIVMMAVDLDNSKIWWGRNGTFFNGNPSTTTNGVSIQTNTDYIFGLSPPSTEDYFVNFGADSTFGGAISAGGNADARGVGNFKYAVPTGFLSLASAALDTPSLQGVDNFSVTLGTEAAIAPTENLIQNSEDLSAGSWSDWGTVTTNQAPNPLDGVISADLVARSATNGKRKQIFSGMISGATYIHSMYLKNVSVGTISSGYTRMFIWESVASYANMIYITWTNNVPAVTYNQDFGGFSPSGGSNIEDLGDGWYRISYIAVANNSNAVQLNFECSTAGTGESLYAWGAQVELAKSGATTPSTYVPTYSAAFASKPYSEKLNLIDGITTENYIRNNTMEGVVAGTPGTPPRHWGVYGNGATVETVGSGVTDDGVEYVDIKFSGTPTNEPYFNLEATSVTNGGIPALNGEEWSWSMYLALQAGSMTNITSIDFERIERTAAGSMVAGAAIASITPTSSLVRHQKTSTLSGGATVGLFLPRVRVKWDGSGAIDATFRIGNPQMEKRSHASQVIKTGQFTMRTNLQPYSVVTNANWSTNGTITDNQDVNPVDGTQNVPTIALNANQQIWDGTTVAAGTLTGSAWLWCAPADVGKNVTLYIRDSTNFAWSSPQSVTLSTTPTRHSVTYTPATNTIAAGVRVYGAGGVTLTTLRVFGVQLEYGSTANTYIPTNGAAVYEPTKRTSLNSFVEIQKNRTASETWAWRFSHDYDKEYATSNTVTYQAIRDQTGTNNWLSYALKIAAASGTAAGSVSHGFASGNTVVTHGLTSSRYAVLLFPRSGISSYIFVYHPDEATNLLLNSTVSSVASNRIVDVTSTTFAIVTGSPTGVYDYLVIDDNKVSSALGAYFGNSSSLGPHISTGFKPSIIIIKRSVGGTSDWNILDSTRNPSNVTSPFVLKANLDVDDEAGSIGEFDILSDGFKLRADSANANSNGSSSEYIYIALADIAGGGSGLPPIYGR
tara:strand:- start:2558 stop:7666 length:5109 start_codon:yes stop_codon:yes gene_type:complete